VKYNKECLNSYYEFLKLSFETKHMIPKKILYNPIIQYERILKGEISNVSSYDPLDRKIRLKWKRIKLFPPLNFILSNDDIQDNAFRRLNSCYKFVLNKINHPILKSTDKQNRNKFEGDLRFEQELELPITHLDATNQIKTFIKYKFKDFGINQDAIEPETKYMNHSILSIPLNMGLIIPFDILKYVIKNRSKIPLNSYEGFLRQICGWREYMYYLFMKHLPYITKQNYWNNHKLITPEWYTAKTKYPIFNNELIKANGQYSHHIVRLMVFQSLLIINGFTAEEIIKWFKKNISLDAYDWVMVSNVYCLGYFCKSFTSRHYLCSSNYIKSISRNYKRDYEWDKDYRLKMQKIK